MAELYADVRGGLDLNAGDMPKAGPAELGPPHGVYLAGYHDGGPVCGGGLKRLPDGACEIKRMYVVPHARRQGLARTLLRAWRTPRVDSVIRWLGWTPDFGSPTRSGSTNPRATPRSAISTTTRWPTTSARSSSTGASEATGDG